jgi:hypothetical protein
MSFLEEKAKYNKEIETGKKDVTSRRFKKLHSGKNSISENYKVNFMSNIKSNDHSNKTSKMHHRGKAE